MTWGTRLAELSEKATAGAVVAHAEFLWRSSEALGELVAAAEAKHEQKECGCIVIGSVRRVDPICEKLGRLNEQEASR